MSLGEALEQWILSDFNPQFIPNSDKYINEKYEDFYKPVQARLREEQINEERRAYYKEAEQNMATDEERKEIFDEMIKNFSNKIRNNDG